jgi:sulfatase maturation enzyme AslB (radical SAM superfamily)
MKAQEPCHVMTKPANHSFKMSDEVLEVYIKGYIEAQLGMKASFAWQGGEPTLAGLPFFETLCACRANDGRTLLGPPAEIMKMKRS